MDLSGKRILFFHVPNYGYHKVMIDAFNRAGAIVDDFDTRPNHSFWTKALIRINRDLLGSQIDKYHNYIIDSIKDNNYDIVYFYKGEAVSSSTVKRLRKLYPKAYFVLYFPDSIKNNLGAKKIIPLFDDCYTFDKKDAKCMKLSFLPLFYSKNMVDIANKKKCLKYDLFFVGTVHSDRYNFISKIVEQYRQYGCTSFTWFYFPSKVLYYKMCLENPMLIKIPKCEFQFTILSANELAERLAESRIVLDIQHPQQTGLTMRTIETLGAKKKLITTNEQIVDYDFYDPDNILLVDRNNPIIPIDFITSPYKEVSEEIYKKYNIDNWVETLLHNGL